MLLPYYIPDVPEAGCDEAGRGCLAGPVYAAAVILPPDIEQRCPELASGLNDSKQLTEKRRYALRPLIEREALAWAVGVCDNREIDQHNILRCSILAMHRALDQLSLVPQSVIVDGNRFAEWVPKDLPTQATDIRGSLSVPTGGHIVPYATIVKGDGRYLSIAAASILAKTYRDDYMQRIHEEFPMYGWRGNKGYPAPSHRQAIRQHGPSPYHRLSFNLTGESPQLQFDFGV